MSGIASVSQRLAHIQYDAEIACRFADRLVRRRSPADGYLRGVGLEFGADLVDRIEAHPLYREVRGHAVPNPRRRFPRRRRICSTSVGAVRDHLDRLGLGNVVLVKGRVEQTFPPSSFKPLRGFGLAHIDLDLYEPTRHVQRHVWERMVR